MVVRAPPPKRPQHTASHPSTITAVEQTPSPLRRSGHDAAATTTRTTATPLNLATFCHPAATTATVLASASRAPPPPCRPHLLTRAAPGFTVAGRAALTLPHQPLPAPSHGLHARLCRQPLLQASATLRPPPASIRPLSQRRRRPDPCSGVQIRHRRAQIRRGRALSTAAAATSRPARAAPPPMPRTRSAAGLFSLPSPSWSAARFLVMGSGNGEAARGGGRWRRGC